MLIYHFTDLESALNIVHSKTFRAYSNNIYNGDSGLNSFPTLKGNFNYGQNFNKEGIILVFDWSGNIDENTSIYMHTETMDRNTTYIQGAWNCTLKKKYNLNLCKYKLIDTIYIM